MADDPSFRVLWSPQARDTLRSLRRKARGSSVGKTLAQVIRAVDDRLRRDPLSVGEVYRTRGNVAEHLAIHQFLAVDFAVDRQRKVVLVRACSVLSGHGLEC